jgi:hypothetical protein
MTEFVHTITRRDCKLGRMHQQSVCLYTPGRPNVDQPFRYMFYFHTDRFWAQILTTDRLDQRSTPLHLHPFQVVLVPRKLPTEYREVSISQGTTTVPHF